ncbi:MAG: DUF2442 domain-containing protein [Blastocatellia bacterium]
MAEKTFDEEYAAAVRAAAQADATEPRAKSARYDRRAKRVVVELLNGATFIFPPELAQGLAGASSADLANVQVTPSGAGLRWPSLDADFSLPGLMMGAFGSPAWMREQARERERTKSKAGAARANGSSNGRRRKELKTGTK